MSSKNHRLRLASVALIAAASGLAATAPATADATRPPHVTAPPTGERQAPSAYVDLPAGTLPAAGRRHVVTVSYRNDSVRDRTVAPQLLLVSPEAGPFLAPADVRLERHAADAGWQGVRVGSQTGTLFTALPSARRTLRPGETLTEVYRLTVVDPRARGTVRPRVAVFD